MKIKVATWDDELNNLLVDWYWCRKGDGSDWATRGHTSPTIGYTTPTHHDYRNGAEDSRAEKQRIASICLAAEAVKKPWFYALQVEARRLATGMRVWPSFIALDEREVLLLEARNLFTEEVLRRKIIDKDQAHKLRGTQ